MNKINWDEEIELVHKITGIGKLIRREDISVNFYSPKNYRHTYFCRDERFFQAFPCFSVDDFGLIDQQPNFFIRNKPKDEEKKTMGYIIEIKTSALQFVSKSGTDFLGNKAFMSGKLQPSDIAKILREEAERLDPPVENKKEEKEEKIKQLNEKMKKWEDVPPEFDKTFKEKFWELVSSGNEERNPEGLPKAEEDKKVYTVEVSKEKIKLIGIAGMGFTEYPIEIKGKYYNQALLADFMRDISTLVDADIKFFAESDEIDWERPIEVLHGILGDNKWVPALFIHEDGSKHNLIIYYDQFKKEASHVYVDNNGYICQKLKVVRNKVENAHE